MGNGKSDSRSTIAWRADAVLAGVTVVWGSSFVVSKNVYQTSPPLQFLFWRFLIASLLLLPFFVRRRSTPGLWRDGLVTGGLLATGMVFQVLGMPDTTASNAAFLTGLSVVLTPFAAYLLHRRVPSLENAVGITLAGAGFFLLTFPAGGAPFQRGDLLVFLCGVVFGFYTVELAERSGRHDAVSLTWIQLAVVPVLAMTVSLLIRSPLFSGWRLAAHELRPVVWEGVFLWSVIYLAVFATLGAFFGQTWAQRHMSATHAAIILALEAVVAAILAAWLLNERLRPRGLAGAGLVLLGIVVSELRLRRRRLSQSSGNVSV